MQGTWPLRPHNVCVVCVCVCCIVKQSSGGKALRFMFLIASCIHGVSKGLPALSCLDHPLTKKGTVICSPVTKLRTNELIVFIL